MRQTLFRGTTAMEFHNSREKLSLVLNTAIKHGNLQPWTMVWVNGWKITKSKTSAVQGGSLAKPT